MTVLGQKENTEEKEFSVIELQSFIILSLFFITGAVGLAFEVLWIRILVNVFGATVYAVSTVISSFFAGLALGSHLFGKIGERIRNPLRMYGALEFCVGVSALITLFILSHMNAVWAAVYSVVGQNPLLYALTRFALCFIILLLPTTLMGGTLPVLSKYFVRNLKSLGWNLGLIYSINTFGALVGCFLVGFVLIEAVGVRHTLYGGVACNMFVALTAFLISMRKKESGEKLEIADEALEKAGQPADALSSKIIGFMPLAFAISGFASLSYELLWTRILVYFIGVQTYAYTIMLITFLFGIALGSMVFARLADWVKDNLFLFGLVELLIGLFSILGLFTIGYLTRVMNYLMYSGFVRTWWRFAEAKFIISAIFMIVPTLLIGGTFPIVSKLVVNNLERLTTRIGKIYALNTIGGIFGSAVTGFLFLPLLGVRHSVLLIVSVNVVLGLMLILTSTKRKSVVGMAANALGIASLAPVAYFATIDRPVLQDWNIHERKSAFDILYCKEGIECTLSVLLNKQTRGRELNINGQSTAYTSYRDIQVHKMLVHVPMLMHPDPVKVLIVGFGMGCTSYEATLYEKAKVTCVELVKDEAETAKYFEDLNRGVLRNPKFNFVHDDGRNYLQVADNTFDVISFNAIHPRLSPGLYTKEFYEICRSRMAPRGVICAWIPTNWVTPEEFRSLIKTFVSVFPESTMWFCNPDHVILIGELKSPEIDFDTFKERMLQPEIYDYMKPAGLGDPFSLMGTLILGPAGLKAYAAGASVVTDDRSQVEFSKCLDYGMNEAVWDPILRVRDKYMSELMAIVRTSSSEERETLYNNLKSLTPFLAALILSDPKYDRHAEALVEYDRALALAPQNENIVYWKLQSLTFPDVQK